MTVIGSVDRERVGQQRANSSEFHKKTGLMSLGEAMKIP